MAREGPGRAAFFVHGQQLALAAQGVEEKELACALARIAAEAGVGLHVAADAAAEAVRAVAQDKAPGPALAQEELRVLVDAVLVHGVHEGSEAAASEGQGPVVLRALAHRDVLDLKRVRVEQAEPVPDGGAARPVRGGEAELFPVRREAAERDVRIFAREEAVSAVFIYAEAAAAAVHEAAAVEPEGQLVYDPALGAGSFERLGGGLRVALRLRKGGVPVAGAVGGEEKAAPARKAQGGDGAGEAAELPSLAPVVGQELEDGEGLPGLGALLVALLAQCGKDDARLGQPEAVHVPGGGQALCRAALPEPEVGEIAVLLHVRALHAEIELLPARGGAVRHEEAGKMLVIHLFQVSLSPFSSSLTASAPRGKPSDAPQRFKMRSSTSAEPTSSSACAASVRTIARAQTRRKRQ